MLKVAPSLIKYNFLTNFRMLIKDGPVPDLKQNCHITGLVPTLLGGGRREG